MEGSSSTTNMRVFTARSSRLLAVSPTGSALPDAQSVAPERLSFPLGMSGL
jgi:hypothetical protein